MAAVWERYTLPDGDTMVLLYHSPPEWASVVRHRLLALGCSEEYASAEEERIYRAERP